MSAGEDRLSSALGKALKPPYAVYRNVAWLEKRPGAEPQDGEADVVIGHPELGVMVIEVKGGRVQRVGGRWESVDRNGTANQIKDPVRAGDERDASAQAGLPSAAGLAVPRGPFLPGRVLSRRGLRPLDDAGRAARDRHRPRRPRAGGGPDPRDLRLVERVGRCIGRWRTARRRWHASAPRAAGAGHRHRLPAGRGSPGR